MVDVTFIFVLLLGGPLAAYVTARVRRHHGWRMAADLVAGAICGPLGATAWVNFAQWAFAREPDEPYMSSGWASFLSDVYYFSPVVGGFIGVGAVALLYRLAGVGPARPQESWGEKIGAGLRIIGYVYAVIALALTIGVIILAYWLEATGFVTLELFYDLLPGPALIVIGWGLARVFRTPGAPPAAPPPR